jgi:competence protein ComGC
MEKTPNYTDKKQRSILEFVIVIVIVVIMMMLLIDVFFSQQTKVTNTAFNSLSQNFTSKVNVVHGQWLMDKQPSAVVLNLLNSSEKVTINVNKKGWVDNEHTSLACHKIWQQVLAIPLQVVKTKVVAIEIQNNVNQIGRLCRYSIANGQYFDYRSDTGKVRLVD